MSVHKLTEVCTSVRDRLCLSGGALLNQSDEAQLVKLKLQHRVLKKKIKMITGVPEGKDKLQYSSSWVKIYSDKNECEFTIMNSEFISNTYLFKYFK